VISTGLATKVKQWLGNTNMFAQSKLHLKSPKVNIFPSSTTHKRERFATDILKQKPHYNSSQNND